MKTILQFCLATALVILISIDASGRGFGGFHGGGFGGFHAGGYGGFRGGYSGIRYGGASYGGGFREGGYDAYRGGGFNAGAHRNSGFDNRGFDNRGFDSGGLNSFRGDESSGLRTNSFSNAIRDDGVGDLLNRGELGSFLGLPTDGGLNVASGTVVKGSNGNVYSHSTAAGRGIAAGPNGAVAGRGFATSARVAGTFGHYSATAMRAQGLACQRWWSGDRIFTAGWCGVHPWGWCPGRYTAAAWAVAAWRWATWPTVGTWLVYTGDPVAYDYGDNINYQDGEVYYGSEPVATQQEYFDGASTLANSGASDADAGGDWLPLGVFALIAPGGTTPEMVFQLAINKQGIIHGNYYDQLAEVNLPVYGAVNKANQRVAWQIGKNKSNVVETGLYNLTQNESTALIHLGPVDTQQVTLVRIKQPTGDAQAGAEQSTPTP